MTILISWSRATVPADNKALHTTPAAVILCTSRDASEPTLIRSLGDPLWGKADTICLGPSIQKSMHATAFAAIAALVRRVAPGATIVGGEAEAGTGALRLADWLMAEFDRSTNNTSPALTLQELHYLFVSGAHRARIIGQVLEQLPNTRNIRHLVDIGAGSAVIPWLLSTSALRGLTNATFVEPNATYRRAAHALWSPNTAVAATIQDATAESMELSGGYGMVMACQAVLLMKPELRPEIFRRIAASLAPGGVLLINEIIRNNRPRNPADTLWDKKLHLPELLELIALVGGPRVYDRCNGWKAPLDPFSISIDQYASNTMFVAEVP